MTVINLHLLYNINRNYIKDHLFFDAPVYPQSGRLLNVQINELMSSMLFKPRLCCLSIFMFSFFSIVHRFNVPLLGVMSCLLYVLIKDILYIMTKMSAPSANMLCGRPHSNSQHWKSRLWVFSLSRKQHTDNGRQQPQPRLHRTRHFRDVSDVDLDLDL